MKIKFSFPYDWPIFRQTPNNEGIWGKNQFFLEDSTQKFDAWVVFNSLSNPNEAINCPNDRIILITPEPYSIQHYPSRFVNQFSHIITNQHQIKHNNLNILHTGTPWFVNKSYNQLVNFEDELPQKTKKISIITSNKLLTEGHKKRFEFAMKLKDYFNNEIDLFGRGINDFDDKWDVLAPYEYNICIENCSQKDYFTEKINDCFLANTFPIYYGCSNLEKYYNSNSFKVIDINNFDLSLKIIEEILNDKSHFKNHLNSLIESRSRYLTNYNIFPLVSNFIDLLGKSTLSSTTNNLSNSFYDIKTISEKLFYKLKK